MKLIVCVDTDTKLLFIMPKSTAHSGKISRSINNLEALQLKNDTNPMSGPQKIDGEYQIIKSKHLNFLWKINTAIPNREYKISLINRNMYLLLLTT